MYKPGDGDAAIWSPRLYDNTVMQLPSSYDDAAMGAVGMN